MSLRLTLRPLAAAVALAILCPNLAIAANDDPGAFWDDGRDGWFYYETPPEPEEAPKPKPDDKPKPGTTTAKVTPPPTPTAPPEQEAAEPPAPLSAAWFRENLDKYADAAWNEPTVENVRAYLYLQRYVMDRSQAFADSAQHAVLGDPVLDETNRRPTASAAAQRLAERANRNRNRVVKSLGDDVGIFFFYSSSCLECASMIPVVRELEKDFALIPISMDGKHLPGKPFPNMREDQGHARQLGVPRAPALYLAAPGEVFEPIAHSPVSVDDARQRILIGAYRQGWISDAEYESARPITNLDIDLTRILPPETFGASGDESSNFIPPSELLREVEASQDRYFEELAQ